ncbi:MAG: hypothetical protein G3M78_00005 [Candidatus Nitrohelix vancouverensis]|uniref:Zinc finger/thioredoxin putative domain-containing protein n=1 Tax=Candidatus Nitrohelix vancouverensis TaxID=2705534 RepID=A0A7T0G4S4_9BACT|nr:MAG: hypothetical protein G3M78_00005 [Candidatus Nitrohelix vancouverensis]
MRIDCPSCKAAYNVELPHLGDKPIEVKCAKCHNKFSVKKDVASDQAPEQESPETNQETPTVAAVQEDADLDGLMDDILTDAAPEEEPQVAETTAEQDDMDLDGLMDDILTDAAPS